MHMARVIDYISKESPYPTTTVFGWWCWIVKEKMSSYKFIPSQDLVMPGYLPFDLDIHCYCTQAIWPSMQLRF